MSSSSSASIITTISPIIVPGAPTCAVPCTTLATNVLDCLKKDAYDGIKCACQNDTFVQTVAQCAALSCAMDQLQSFVNDAAGICLTFGAPLPTTMTLTANSTTFVISLQASATPTNMRTAPATSSRGSASPGSGISSTAQATRMPTQASQGRKAAGEARMLRVALMVILVVEALIS